MRFPKLGILGLSLVLLAGVGLVQAKPDRPDQKDAKLESGSDKTSGFKPVEINNELNQNDPKDPQLDQPSKKYTIKLAKYKTYIIDLNSKDFDAYLRLLSKKGDQLAEDDDSGGDLNAQIIFSARASEDHQIVVTTFDGQLGKFKLKVRELALKTEGKPLTVKDGGININGKIGPNDVSPLSKLGKIYSVEMKAGQTYTIDLASQDLDSYLYLFDGKSKLLAQDDDSGGNLDSRIVFKCPQDGVYHLIASSLGGQETGDFTLNVSKE